MVHHEIKKFHGQLQILELDLAKFTFLPVVIVKKLPVKHLSFLWHITKSNSFTGKKNYIELQLRRPDLINFNYGAGLSF